MPTAKQSTKKQQKPIFFFVDDSDETDEIEDNPRELAKSVGVNILRNKEFRAGYQVKGKVVAALFDDQSDRDEYSFDIVVSPQFQKLGLGGKLLDVALGLYADQKEYRGSDYKMRLDVINPAMERMLERKGFARIDQEGGITIMERRNSSAALPMEITQGSVKKAFDALCTYVSAGDDVGKLPPILGALARRRGDLALAGPEVEALIRWFYSHISGE